MAMKTLIALATMGMMSSWLGVSQSQEISSVQTTARPHSHYRLKRAVCYLTGWARLRRDPVQFHPEDLDTGLCTHVIFAFALLDETGLNLIPQDPDKDPEMYRRLVALKRERPSMKVLLSVGGYNMGSEQFTKTVSSSANMYTFSRNVVEFLHKYSFDGLDIDWEFPADRGSPAEDKERFTELLKMVQRDFSIDYQVTGRTRLTLSVAISPMPAQITQSYELLNISKYVEFITALTYDLHGSWDGKIGHHTALHSPTQDSTDGIDYLIDWILKTQVPASKINMGLAFYGRSFNLTNPQNSQVGSAVTGPGSGGSLVGEEGLMAYYEVCKILTEHNDTVTESGRLPNSESPYMVDGNRWTGYDDMQSLKEKVSYATEKGLGGWPSGPLIWMTSTAFVGKAIIRS